LKKITSENGYALVLTLLIFTVFMIIGVSVWGIIINNSKQIQNTETDIQSTDLAEMGFVYNYTAISNTYQSLSNNLKTYILDKVNQDMGNSIVRPSDYYTKEAIKELYRQLTDNLRTTGVLKQTDIVSLQGDNIFTITRNLDYNPADYTVDEIKIINNITFLLDEDHFKITILFNSTGSTGNLNTTKSLKLNFDIKINSITVTYPDDSSGPIGGGGDGGTAEPPDIQFEVPEPNVEGLGSCNKDGNSFTGPGCVLVGTEMGGNNLDIIGTTIFTDGNLSIDKNVSDITNSTVYISGEFDAEKITNLTGSKLHVDDSAEIKHIDSLTSGSVLEVGGDLTVSGNIGNFNGSIIRVKGDANLGHINQGFHNNSKLFVGGNLTMANINSGFNNSLIKVYGDAQFGHINGGSTNSKICVFGTLLGIDSYPSSLKIYTLAGTNAELFKNACGSLADKVKDIEFEWAPSADVEYQYEYN
jgi:hypothetical protein